MATETSWSKRVEKLGDDSVTISGKEIPIKHGELEQSTLRYYAENPRLYTVLGPDSELPDQDKIQEELQSRDHVKRLKKDIEANGGLLEPIIVRDGTFEVLEGNSRLAAYRSLAMKNPKKWGKMKCQILPGDIDDAQIFTILGQLHIRGKQDWDKYEQAGYLWRRHHCHEVPIDTLSKQIGVSAAEIRKQIDTYQFMKDKKEEDIKKWSFYEVYLTNRAVKSAREKYADLDNIVADQIQNNRVGTAQEFRTMIGEVAKNKKIMKDYANQKHNLEASFERVAERGLTSDFGKQLKRFQVWVTDTGRRKELRKHMEGSTPAKKDAKFRIKKIVSAVEKLESIVNEKKS